MELSALSSYLPPSSLSRSPAKAEELKDNTRYDLGDKVVKAEVEDIPFDKFLKYKTYEVGVATDSGLKTFRGGFVHGPGHHISAIAAMAFDEAMHPHLIFKTGDTRLSRSERQEPYVLSGGIAGRMDKEGASAPKIVLAELAEEL